MKGKVGFRGKNYCIYFVIGWGIFVGIWFGWEVTRLGRDLVLGWVSLV